MLLRRPFQRSTDCRYAFGLQSLWSHSPKRASATVNRNATFVKATVMVITRPNNNNTQEQLSDVHGGSSGYKNTPHTSN